MRRLPLLLILLLLALLGLAACGEDEEAASEEESSAAGEVTAIGCEKVEKPAPKGEQTLSKPTEELDRRSSYIATVSTSCGDFQILLDVKRAPKTAASFMHLAQEKLYDGTDFHRIVQGFVIQGGDPLGDGTGGPGYSVREAPPKSLSYDKGVVAMAKAGNEPPGTSGSQFFVMTENNDLPPEYALLGEVIKGMEVVEKIGASQADPNTGQPAEPVVIRSVAVSRD